MFGTHAQNDFLALVWFNCKWVTRDIKNNSIFSDDFDTRLEQNFAVNKIHGWRTDKPRHESIGRTVIKFVWGGNLREPAAVHHCHSSCQGHGFNLVMGHVNKRAFDFLMEFF